MDVLLSVHPADAAALDPAALDGAVHAVATHPNGPALFLVMLALMVAVVLAMVEAGRAR